MLVAKPRKLPRPFFSFSSPLRALLLREDFIYSARSDFRLVCVFFPNIINIIIGMMKINNINLIKSNLININMTNRTLSTSLSELCECNKPHEAVTEHA